MSQACLLGGFGCGWLSASPHGQLSGWDIGYVMTKSAEDSLLWVLKPKCGAKWISALFSLLMLFK